MPSTFQSGKSKGSYERIVSESDRDDDTFVDAVRMLSTKNDPTIRSLVRGIRDVDRARAYVEAELAIADAEDRDPRSSLIGLVNTKIDELKADEDDDDTGE